jgi:hypothetical protein
MLRIFSKEEILMHRMFFFGILLIGGLALAQDPPMSERPPASSKARDRAPLKPPAKPTAPKTWRATGHS